MASEVDCSFAGGCLWTVGATNIKLQASTLSATVCNFPCVFDSAASANNNEYKCRAPLLATRKSVLDYPGLIEEQDWKQFNGVNGITLGLYSQDPTSFGSQAFDGDYTTNTGTASDCSVGWQITNSDYRGTVSRIRYFFPR